MLSLSESDSINQILYLDENSFEVPLYQRRYVWDETNWNKIWTDIIDQVNIEPSERGVGHFTGPIVTRLIDEVQNRHEVIDGQQRLTTLQIIFCVIKDLCEGVEELANDGVVKDARKHVQDSSGSHKLFLTTYDQPTFKKIVEGEFGKKIHEHKTFDETQNKLQSEKIKEVISEVFNNITISSNILNAYIYFYEVIRSHIQENQDNADRLLSAITSDFKLIHLSLDETDGAEAEKVFESINATGRMLSDFDYLRNNLFLRARKLEKNDDGELYRDVFYKNSDYWRFENESNYWNTEKQELFIRAFLMATWKPERCKEIHDKPFDEYQKYSKFLEKTYPDDIDKIPYEFQQLSGWAKSFLNLLKREEFKAYKKFREDLSLDDLDEFLLLDAFLLYVIHHDDEHFSKLACTVTILESYIVRSLLVLEDATYSQADIKEECYSKINTFFNDAVTGGRTFDLSQFTTYLDPKVEKIDDLKVNKEFAVNASNKDGYFIKYILNRIKGIDPDPRTLSVTSLSILKTAILNQHNNMRDFMDKFKRLWPDPFS